MPSTLGLVVHHSDPSFAVGIWNGSVVIQSWIGKAKVEHIRHAYDASRAVISKLGVNEKTASLAIADPRGGLPDDETRKLSSELVQKVGPHTAASAVIIEGDGFWASAIRAAVQGIHLIARTNIPQRAFATVPPAADWVVQMMKLPPEKAQELVAAVGVLRER